MHIKLNNKVVLVTGASRGIGREIAKQLGAAGAKVAVHYGRSSEEAVSLCKEIGRGAEAFRADLADAGEAHALFKNVVAEYGQIDILVNNAGITKDGLLFRMGDDAWDDVIGTNLTSCFSWIKNLARPMTRKRWGRIINNSSVIGLTGNAGQANYAAAKAGMLGLTKSLAKEFAARNVTVNAVAPGFIATDMTAELNEEQQKAIVGVIPMKRMGSAEDIAHATAFLASEDAGYITGQVFTVDGGMVM